jgi:hypothetical protein
MYVPLTVLERPFGDVGAGIAAVTLAEKEGLA